MVALRWVDETDGEQAEKAAPRYRHVPERPGQQRPGQPRPGQPRPGQPRPGQPRPGQPRPGQVQAGQVQAGQVQAGRLRPVRTARLELEVYRRRRKFFWRRLLVVVVIAGLGALVWRATETLLASGRGEVPGAVAPRAYIARPGDTIWSIAVRYSHGGDPREMVGPLEAEIGGGTLQPGDRLTVP
jgi:hypothetical protein